MLLGSVCAHFVLYLAKTGQQGCPLLPRQAAVDQRQDTGAEDSGDPWRHAALPSPWCLRRSAHLACTCAHCQVSAQHSRQRVRPYTQQHVSPHKHYC